MRASKKTNNKRKAEEELDPTPPDDTAISSENEEDVAEDLSNSEGELSDTDVDESDVTVEKKDPKRSKSVKNASRRAYGYRKLARMAGYIPMSSEAASGKDAIHFLISPHDVQRCMRYIPAGRGHSYSETELALRQELLAESITPKALQEAQARMDSVLRRVMNACVKNIVDTGRLRVSASVMNEVLRPFGKGGEFTSVAPPEGVLIEATRKGVIRDTGKFNHAKDVANHGASTDKARVAARALNKAQIKAKVVKA